jgi:hypothetical protein
MRDSELKYFYPYSFERKLNLKERLKDRDGFIDELWGKTENFYESENYYGTRRNRDNLSLLESSLNDYLAHEFFDWERWFKNGRNIFSFSKELLEMLNHTDVCDITYESFNLPYDNFYISLKSLELRMTEDSDKVIEEVYVSVNRDAMSEKEYDVENYITDYALEFHFVGDFEGFIIKYHDKVWNDSGSGGESFWDYAFYFNKKENIVKINDAIKDWKYVFTNTFFPEKSEEVTDDHLDLFNYLVKLIDSTCIIVVNCLLYLSMPCEEKDLEFSYPGDLPFNFNKKLNYAKNKKEISKIERKIHESGYSKIQYVGYSYQKSSIIDNHNINRLSPHWRRGHWRNQRFGEKLINKK